MNNESEKKVYKNRRVMEIKFMAVLIASQKMHTWISSFTT